MNLPIILFSTSVGGLLVWGLRRKGRIYEYPFLAGVAFAGFVLPQAIGLGYDTFAPPDAYARLLYFAMLCAAMCWAGYAAAQRETCWRGLGWQYDLRRLEAGAVCFLVLGLYFHHRLNGMDPATMAGSGGGWSGASVAYLFFADLARYGLFIGVLIWLRERSIIGLGVAVIGVWPDVEAAVFYGRRAPTAELILGLLVAVWFTRSRIVPRWAFAPLALIAMLMASFSAGDYRQHAADGISAEVVQTIPWRENVVNVLAGGGVELPNALYTIDLIAKDGSYDFGTYHWDRLVFNYVPAQIVGQDFKGSLYLSWGARLENTGDVSERVEMMYGYVRQGGATATGLLDAFASFGWLGCMKYFAIAWIMALIWGAAQRGDFTAQLVYLLVVVDAMHTVTHDTHWFFGRWPHMALFLLPVLRYARTPVLRGAPFGSGGLWPSHDASA